MVPPSFKSNSSEGSNKNETTSQNETLSRQSPLETIQPQLVAPPSSSAALSQQQSNYPDFCQSINSSSVLNSAPPALSPPPLLTHPPPISNISGSLGNPYKLKSVTHTYTNSPVINWGPKSQSVPASSDTSIPFFVPPSENAPSGHTVNLLSGPQIGSTSTPDTFQQNSTDISNNGQLQLHNFTPEDNKSSNTSVLSSVQTFTSALSNFIAPSKSPQQIPPTTTSAETNFSDNSSVPIYGYNDNNDSVPHFSEVLGNNNKVSEEGTTNLPQLQPFQSEFFKIQSNSSVNKITNSVPTIPFFSNNNNINNSFLDSNIPTHSPNNPLVVDNTVCVSAITTALSSPAAAPTSCGVSKGHLENQLLTSDLHSLSDISKPDIQSLAASNPVNFYNQQTNLPCPPNNNTGGNITNDNQVNNNNFYAINQDPASTAVNFTFPSESTNNSNPWPSVNTSLQINTTPNPVVNNNPLQESTNVPLVADTQQDPNNLLKLSDYTVPLSTTASNNLYQPQPANNLIERPVPVVQPIPTFNYFSQSNCFPPPLEPPSLTSNNTKTELPQSSFFKPIESPNTVNAPVQSQQLHSLEKSVPLYVNPLHTVPPKVSFPPPNISVLPKVTPSNPQPETTSSPQKDGPIGELDLEELDQIPLEGSAIPLYNPDYINRKKKVEVPDSSNTYRLSKGLKKPTYAPVPDLSVTEKKTCPGPVPLASSPTNASVSSLEEMASIEAQGHRLSQTQSPGISHPKSPSGSSTTLEPYYANIMQAPSYRLPYHHWFFKSGRHKNSPWTPFSMADSLNLEQVFTSSDLDDNTKVATDGGRYDVQILHRKKIPVYWEEPPGEVRRCSWFVKSLSDSRYTPYDENIAALLEDEYKMGCETNEWNRRIELADGEVIILHSPTAMAHHVRSSSPDTWGSQPTLQQKPRVVKRGVDDFDIPKGESKQVDHLLLVVHGVGKACDLRFRSLMEVVDDFRSISLQLVQSHFHSGVQNGNVGRVEILPVEWHGALHTETINDRLSAITLPSIPRAREFTNETLLDILFYTSPVFCEKIVNAVGAELNRVYTLYKSRNPGFRGEVSLSGHSLGSLILFDILGHQQPLVKKPHLSSQASLAEEEEDETVEELGCLAQKARARLSRRMSYLTIGPGTGQPYTIYPQLLFQPRAFFALGSPIGMFVTVRGLEALGEDFKFPTCSTFLNIFHPNDPVAYRIEALIKPEMATVPAVLIPHHKGRKRMHLELKETMAHVTAALKQKLVDSMKNTWNAVYQLALFSRKDNALPGEVSKVIEDEVLRDGYLDSDPPIGVVGEEGAGSDVKVGKLNGGRRIDYVLQEAPLETFNQYISAIRSHLVYWESEDTVLMILKEIYGLMGIAPDSQVSQPILPFDMGSENDTYSEYTYSIGAPPTQFVRK